LAFKLKILPECDLLLQSYSGPVGATDFEAVWQILSGATEYRADFDDIAILGPDADYSDVAHDVSRAQASRFVEYHHVRQGRPKHAAFICHNDMQRAMARLFGAYVKAHGPAHVGIECFTQLKPALEWIGPSKGPGRQLDHRLITRLVREMGDDWCCADEAAE